jgi:hypothetical protein
MRALRRRLALYRRLVICTAVVGAVCAATDWPFGDVMGVNWDEHPLWAGVLTGGLLLVAGYFGVETYLRERDTERWEMVARVAFKAVGLSAALLRDGMDRLIGSDEHLRYRAQPLTDAVIDGVRQRQRSCGVSRSGGQHREDRLKKLIPDQQWAHLAVEGLDQLKWQHRATLANWAPLMLANERLAGDFSRLAELNEMVSKLQEPLRRRADIDERNECPILDSDRVSQLIADRWEAIVTRTVLLQEDFMRAAGDDSWTHDGARVHLSADGLRELVERDRETRSGIHAPQSTSGGAGQPAASL